MSNPLDNIARWQPPGTAPLGPRPEKGSDTARRRASRPAPVKPKREGISPRLRAMVMERDKFCCVLCGSVGSKENPLQIGHVVPVAQGGTSGEENLRVECRECNLGGGARMRAKPGPDLAARRAHLPLTDSMVEKLGELVGKKRKGTK